MKIRSIFLIVLPLLLGLLLALTAFSSFPFGDCKLEAFPPPDAPKTGAHPVHLSQSLFSKTYECTECHSKKNSNEVVFGPLASKGGASPQWNASKKTCSNVYCHGATSSGGLRTSVKWAAPTERDLIVCGACHGNPPPANHVKNANCELCHRGISTGAGLNKELHVNGEVDVIHWNPTDSVAVCQDCHGIPPRENHLRNADCGLCHPPLAGTKPHTWKIHMDGKVNVDQWDPAASRGIQCNACHGIPPTRPGHLKSGQCSMCHPVEEGKNFSSKRHMNGDIDCVQWDENSDIDCGDCHGIPPEMDHPSDDQCYKCHRDVMNEDGEIIRYHLHMNGEIDTTVRK